LRILILTNQTISSAIDLRDFVLFVFGRGSKLQTFD